MTRAPAVPATGVAASAQHLSKTTNLFETRVLTRYPVEAALFLTPATAVPATGAAVDVQHSSGRTKMGETRVSCRLRRIRCKKQNFHVPILVSGLHCRSCRNLAIFLDAGFSNLLVTNEHEGLILGKRCLFGGRSGIAEHEGMFKKQKTFSAWLSSGHHCATGRKKL